MPINLGNLFDAAMHFAPVAAQSYAGHLQGQQLGEQQRAEQEEKRRKEKRALRELDQREAQIELERERNRQNALLNHFKTNPPEPTPYDPAADPEVRREEYFRDNQLGRYAPDAGGGADPGRWISAGSGLIVNTATGETRPVGTGDGSGAGAQIPMANAEARTRILMGLPRAEQALTEIERFLGDGDDVPVESFLGRALPGRFLQSEDVQAYQAAAERLATAILRVESGAAITEDEAKRYARQFIPQPEDKPEVVRQKLAVLRSTVRRMRALGGQPTERPAPAEAPAPSNPAAIHAAGLGHSAQNPADLWEQLVAGGMAPDEATAEVQRRMGGR